MSRAQFRLVVSMIWVTGALMGTPMAVALRVVTTEPDNITGILHK